MKSQLKITEKEDQSIWYTPTASSRPVEQILKEADRKVLPEEMKERQEEPSNFYYDFWIHLTKFL